MPNRRGSIRLFRFAGVDVFLHWSWFLVAVFEISSRTGNYSSVYWTALEYLALFAIVLTHEFGHALACRQVGGTANQIVLWPLGGVAYVDPPPRPGATLWSIAAGPLVNVALLPVFYIVVALATGLKWAQTLPDIYTFVRAVFFINLVLLAFNILPVYPLDGGQILRSLLWFVVGRARSLQVATLIGFVGVAALFLLAIRNGSLWLGILGAFLVMNCWAGLKHSFKLLRLAKLPRHQGFACPRCQAAPLVGNFWRCGACQAICDPFASQGICPNCGTSFPLAPCVECGRPNAITEWIVPGKVASASGVA